MTRRDLRLVCMLAAVMPAAALVVAAAASGGGLAFMAPAILMVVPLLLGRYLGEHQIARLTARRQARRAPARAPRVRGQARPVRRVFSRGGALIARSLAVRPPPFTLPA